MTAATLTVIGAPCRMTIWSKLGLGIMAVVVGWWGLSSFDYERDLSPTALAQWLNDAGPLGPLLLMGSMVCAVIIPPIPSLPLDLAAGATFGPFYGALYAVIGAEIGAIFYFLIARVLSREALSRFMNTETTFYQKCTDHQLPDQPVCAPAPWPASRSSRCSAGESRESLTDSLYWLRGCRMKGQMLSDNPVSMYRPVRPMVVSISETP